MEDAVFSQATMVGALADYDMDFEYIDELLLEGCWLETIDGSDFLSSSNSSALFDTSFGWRAMDTHVDFNTDVTQKDNQEDRGNPLLFEKHTLKTASLTHNMALGECYAQPDDYTLEGSDLGRRWWIGPRGTTPGAGASMMERLTSAVGHIKELEREKDVLIQVWIPENRGGRRVLRTSELAFSMNSTSKRLAKYRDISVNYQFSAEENSKEGVGMPSRVFLGKIPEWSPDVQFFRSDEYARVDFATQCGVRGTLAIPVFDRGSRTCVGVIEVVMTTQQIKYSSELEIVSKALEAVDLRSSNVLETPNPKACNSSYHALFPEIREVLGFACESHRLPLAQTWISCSQQGNTGCCRHSDENYINCLSTVEEACYVADPFFQAFHEACSEHHLLKGQGLAGEAFTTNEPCFSTDIRSFGNTKYPLSHHARMFGLNAAVAIRLRSIHSAKTDFVLEFFLPVDCVDIYEQRNLLSSLSLIIQEYFQSLRVITNKELRAEADRELPSNCREQDSHLESRSCQESSPTSCLMNGGNASSFVPEKPGEAMAENSSHNTNLKGSVEDSTFVEDGSSNPRMGRTGEKRRIKAEKTITLQILQKYFAGSLKDAAKSLGVCPTTLKRVCRQHGIKRWPSRKIKKVGHSLQKLQVVIDSVNGASGSFHIDSFYTNFSDLASPNMAKTSPLSASPKGDYDHKSSSKSVSSSCSQSSSSSHCGSSRAAKQLITGDEYQMKRARSEAELNTPGREGPTLLPRSKSHKTLGERSPEVENLRRIKVSYGDEKIRFRMNKDWGFKELRGEMGRRFGVEEMSTVDIKYLDDDSEWVLLTCEADWEECVDVYKFTQSSTFKLSMQLSRHHCGSFDSNELP